MADADLPNLTPDQISHFERLINNGDAIKSLRQYAIELSRSGMKRKEVYRIFLTFHEILQSQGREDEVATIGDVMDMITDTYAPFNLNLPQ